MKLSPVSQAPHGDRLEVPELDEEDFGEASLPQSLRVRAHLYHKRTQYMIYFTPFLHKLW